MFINLNSYFNFYLVFLNNPSFAFILVLENEQLKLLPQASPHHTALAAVSQQHLTNLNHLPLTPQLHPALRQQTLNNSHASNQASAMVAGAHHTNTHSPGTTIGTPMQGLMMTTRPTANTHPLLLGNFV